MAKQEKDAERKDHQVQPSVEQPREAGKAKKKHRDGLYVHPRSSVTRPVKVACPACISGHRSGDCAHYDRVLLKIRAAGRPSQVCHHPSSCGGACLKPKSYIVPSAQPEWCKEHPCCIANWQYSDDSPAYPVPAKRKQRSPSPAASSTTSPQPAAPKAMSSCCSSSHSEPWKQSLPASSPVVPITAGITAYHTSPVFQPFASSSIALRPHVPQAAAFNLEHTVSDHLDTPYTSGFFSEIIPSRPILNTSRDEEPPSKRPCPGNGYQCPCDGDANCNCATCYTHNRGFEQHGSYVPVEAPVMMPPEHLEPRYACHDFHTDLHIPSFDDHDLPPGLGHTWDLDDDHLKRFMNFPESLEPLGSDNPLF